MHALFDLKGKTALVTGSARGLGLAYAQGLASAGARVFLNNSKGVGLQDAVDKLRQEGYDVQGSVFDVTDEVAVERVFAEFDAQGIEIDILEIGRAHV